MLAYTSHWVGAVRFERTCIQQMIRRLEAFKCMATAVHSSSCLIGKQLQPWSSSIWFQSTDTSPVLESVKLPSAESNTSHSRLSDPQCVDIGELPYSLSVPHRSHPGGQPKLKHDTKSMTREKQQRTGISYTIIVPAGHLHALAQPVLPQQTGNRLYSTMQSLQTSGALALQEVRRNS